MRETEQKEELVLDEPYITDKVIEYLVNKEKGNWHEDKVKRASLHQKGVDIRLVGGKRNSEYFFIECKGKSSSDSANKESNWIHALGQIIQRMDVNSFCKSESGKTVLNNAYKYGLGLYWVSAKVALKRIPRNIAKTLNLHIFSCSDEGVIKEFTPKDFGQDYNEEIFR